MKPEDSLSEVFLNKPREREAGVLRAARWRGIQAAATGYFHCCLSPLLSRINASPAILDRLKLGPPSFTPGYRQPPGNPPICFPARDNPGFNRNPLPGRAILKPPGALFIFIQQHFVLAALSIVLLVSPYPAFAAFELFSINDDAVVMYDAPSLKASKLYVASRNLPVEAVVKVEGWVKIRDSTGSLAWVEEKNLSEKRYVVVTAPLAEAHQGPNENSPLVFKAEQEVILEWLEPAENGWVKVRHRDGQNGYVRINQVWGS